MLRSARGRDHGTSRAIADYLARLLPHLWASKPEGFGQVGCVYTAQGFEYDWNGVIIGPDLVWRKDRWVSRRRFNKDPDFRSVSAVNDAQFDRLVRHVYKVLMTRGMVGTLLYSTDEETRDFLRAMVP